MQSLYVEVTPAVIPEGIFPSKHTNISALKEAFDILSPFPVACTSASPWLIFLLLMLYQVCHVQTWTFPAEMSMN